MNGAWRAITEAMEGVMCWADDHGFLGDTVAATLGGCLIVVIVGGGLLAIWLIAVLVANVVSW